MINTMNTILGCSFDLKNLLQLIWDENNYSFVSKKKLKINHLIHEKSHLESKTNKNLKKYKKSRLKFKIKLKSDVENSHFSYNALPSFLKKTHDLI